MLRKPKQLQTAAKTKTSASAAENALLIREAHKITEALGKMFAPCCEVVLHDLTRPGNSIIAIECPLSGRKIGQPTTEMGLARIKDPSFPEVVQNYANTFPDGRQAKSTSIGLKNSQGKFVAAICLNLDISLFSALQRILEQLNSPNVTAAPVRESLRSRSLDDIRRTIETFAAQQNVPAQMLRPLQRQEIIQELAQAGLLQLRGAIPAVAKSLNISRASVYSLLRK